MSSRVKKFMQKKASSIDSKKRKQTHHNDFHSPHPTMSHSLDLLSPPSNFSLTDSSSKKRKPTLVTPTCTELSASVTDDLNNSTAQPQFNEYINRRVSWKFSKTNNKKGPFFILSGRIVSYNGTFWRVVYDDGDEEDYDHMELQEGLENEKVRVKNQALQDIAQLTGDIGLMGCQMQIMSIHRGIKGKPLKPRTPARFQNDNQDVDSKNSPSEAMMSTETSTKVDEKNLSKSTSMPPADKKISSKGSAVAATEPVITSPPKIVKDVNATKMDEVSKEEDVATGKPSSLSGNATQDSKQEASTKSEEEDSTVKVKKNKPKRGSTNDEFKMDEEVLVYYEPDDEWYEGGCISKINYGEKLKSSKTNASEEVHDNGSVRRSSRKRISTLKSNEDSREIISYDIKYDNGEYTEHVKPWYIKPLFEDF